jgi:hypothetical protein
MAVAALPVVAFEVVVTFVVAAAPVIPPAVPVLQIEALVHRIRATKWLGKGGARVLGTHTVSGA